MVFEATGIKEGFKQMRILLNRIRELIEWQKLIDQEHVPGTPPGFDPHTSLHRQLCCDAHQMHDLFLYEVTLMHEVLDRHELACTTDERRQWNRRLQALENELRSLQVTQRFINT